MEPLWNSGDSSLCITKDTLHGNPNKQMTENWYTRSPSASILTSLRRSSISQMFMRKHTAIISYNNNTIINQPNKRVSACAFPLTHKSLHTVDWSAERRYQERKARLFNPKSQLYTLGILVVLKRPSFQINSAEASNIPQFKKVLQGRLCNGMSDINSHPKGLMSETWGVKEEQKSQEAQWDGWVHSEKEQTQRWKGREGEIFVRRAEEAEQTDLLARCTLRVSARVCVWNSRRLNYNMYFWGFP